MMTTANVITFDNVTVNEGNAFNVATSTMIPPFAGLYWIHVSVGLAPGTATNVQVADKSRLIP